MGRTDAAGVFHPTPLMIAYAFAYLGAICEGKPRHDELLAGQIGCDRSTIVKWRPVPGFLDWLTAQCTSNRRGGLERLLNRSLELGIRGSVKHMEFYAKYSGEATGLSPLGKPAPNGAGEHERTPIAAGYTIVSLVARPEPLPLSAESGDERPKLPPPGSPPVVDGQIVQRLHVPMSAT